MKQRLMLHDEKDRRIVYGSDCSYQIVTEQARGYSVSPISVRLRAIMQAPFTAASVPSDEVNTGTSWLISLNEYWRIANLMYCRK